MAKRQSLGSPGTWHATKSRSEIPSKLAISCGLLACWTNQPFFSQFCKLILGAQYEEFLPFHHTAQEMISCRQLRAEFCNRKHGRVDFSRSEEHTSELQSLMH